MSGRSPIRSWTRSGSPKGRSSPTSAPAAAGSRCGWRAASGRTGVVYAEDIQPPMLEAISRRMQRENLTNVQPVLGTPTDPRLPPGLDAVLIVDAYHEMDEPADPTLVVTLLRNVARSLKPQGRLGIVDFTPGGGGPGPAAGSARRSGSGHQGGRGGGPAADLARGVSAVPVPAGLRAALTARRRPRNLPEAGHHRRRRRSSFNEVGDDEREEAGGERARKNRRAGRGRDRRATETPPAKIDREARRPSRGPRSR